MCSEGSHNFAKSTLKEGADTGEDTGYIARIARLFADRDHGACETKAGVRLGRRYSLKENFFAKIDRGLSLPLVCLCSI